MASIQAFQWTQDNRVALAGVIRDKMNTSEADLIAAVAAHIFERYPEVGMDYAKDFGERVVGDWTEKLKRDPSKLVEILPDYIGKDFAPAWKLGKEDLKELILKKEGEAKADFVSAVASHIFEKFPKSEKTKVYILGKLAYEWGSALDLDPLVVATRLPALMERDVDPSIILKAEQVYYEALNGAPLEPLYGFQGYLSFWDQVLDLRAQGVSFEMASKAVWLFQAHGLRGARLADIDSLLGKEPFNENWRVSRPLKVRFADVMCRAGQKREEWMERVYSTSFNNIVDVLDKLLELHLFDEASKIVSAVERSCNLALPFQKTPEEAGEESPYVSTFTAAAMRAITLKKIEAGQSVMDDIDFFVKHDC